MCYSYRLHTHMLYNTTKLGIIDTYGTIFNWDKSDIRIIMQIKCNNGNQIL